RWFPGLPRRMRLSLSNLALIAPDDSGLPAVAAERRYFETLAGEGVAVSFVPATVVEVYKALASGTYDGIHFSGHGAFRNPNPDRSVIELQAGEQLSPEAISGRVRNLEKGRPLVFLNACQVGRGGLGLVDVGGWSKRFVGAGAAAFVGAYWSIFDQPASEFAQVLYDELRRGCTLGAAALAARKAIRAPGDP